MIPAGSPHAHHQDTEWLEIDRICADVSKFSSHQSLTSAGPSNEQTPTVHAGVSLHPNPSKYSHDVQKALKDAESLFTLNGEIDQCIKACREADSQLRHVESTLDGIISSLQKGDLSLTETGRQISQSRNQADAVNIVERHISAFSKMVSVEPDLMQRLQDANPHSVQFKSALKTLSTKLAFVSLDTNFQSQSCVHTREQFNQLRQAALRRVEERLAMSLALLSDPSSNFEILREALLRKQSALLEFAIDHDHEFGEKLVRQYGHLASKVIDSNIDEYCKLFSRRPAKTRSSDREHGLSSLTKATTGFFSDVLAETWTGSSLSTHGTPSAGTLYDHDITNFDAPEYLTDTLDAVLRRWIATSRLMTPRVPALCASEITLRNDDFQFRVEEVLHNCTMFFMEVFENERRFLEGTFGEGASMMLEDIFDSSHMPILLLLKEEMEDVTHESSSDLVPLLVSLLLARWHRTAIVTNKSVDSRIKYMVEAEKILQTALLERFDSETASVSTAPDSGMLPTTTVEYSRWIVRRFSLVLRALTVSSRGCAEVGGQDIFEIVNRRIQTFTRKLTDDIKSFESTQSPQKDEETRLCASACALTALDDCAKFVESTTVIQVLREPLQVTFKEASSVYAKHVVNVYARDLTDIESCVNSRSIAESGATLSSFYSSYERLVKSIGEEYVFMEKHPMSKRYHQIARNWAFDILCSKNDRIASLIRLHAPKIAHLVVPKSALRLAIKGFCEESQHDNG